MAQQAAVRLEVRWRSGVGAIESCATRDTGISKHIMPGVLEGLLMFNRGNVWFQGNG
jgi:hypothetical protein